MKMGSALSNRKSSPRTPLAAMLLHFKQGFSGDYGNDAPLDPRELKDLCQNVWTELNVGWPAQGSVDLQLISKVLEQVGSDVTQYPYIHSWQILVQENKKWLKKCRPKVQKKKVTKPSPLFALKSKKAPTVDYKPRSKTPKKDYKKPHVVAEEEEEWIAPPPYLPRPPAAAARPTSTTGRATPARSSSASSFSPSSPDPCFEESQDYVVEMPDEDEEEHTTSRTRTYDLRKKERAVPTAPLREVVQMVPQADGPSVPVSAYQFIPFTSGDLVSWKSQNPPYSEAPQQLTDLCESVMNSHNPTWQDCEQLLLTLFTREERTRIKEEAHKILKARAPAGSPEADWVAEHCPLQDPRWDPNVPAQMAKIRGYQKILIEAMRAGMKRPVNLAKPTEVRQEANETPDHFYDRLLDAYQRYTPLDVSDPANQRLINVAFVAQSWPDVRRKLQRKEGFPGYPISLLLELARKVFDNREEEGKKEQDKKLQKKSQLLAAAITGKLAENPPTAGQPLAYRSPQPQPVYQQPVVPLPPPRQPRLQRNQCKNCFGFGHWAQECGQAPQAAAQPQPHPQRQRFGGRGRGHGGRSQPGHQYQPKAQTGGQGQNGVYQPAQTSQAPFQAALQELPLQPPPHQYQAPPQPSYQPALQPTFQPSYQQPQQVPYQPTFQQPPPAVIQSEQPIDYEPTSFCGLAEMDSWDAWNRPGSFLSVPKEPRVTNEGGTRATLAGILSLTCPAEEPEEPFKSEQQPASAHAPGSAVKVLTAVKVNLKGTASKDFSVPGVRVENNPSGLEKCQTPVPDVNVTWNPFGLAAYTWGLVQHCHEATHRGKTALAERVPAKVPIERIHQPTSTALPLCLPDTQSNARQEPSGSPRKNCGEDTLFEVLSTDLSQTSPYGPFMLVFMCGIIIWELKRLIKTDPSPNPTLLPCRSEPGRKCQRGATHPFRQHPSLQRIVPQESLAASSQPQHFPSSVLLQRACLLSEPASTAASTACSKVQEAQAQPAQASLLLVSRTERPDAELQSSPHHFPLSRFHFHPAVRLQKPCDPGLLLDLSEGKGDLFFRSPFYSWSLLSLSTERFNGEDPPPPPLLPFATFFLQPVLGQ